MYLRLKSKRQLRLRRIFIIRQLRTYKRLSERREREIFKILWE